MVIDTLQTTCSDTQTIHTGSPISICGHLVQVYDIKPMFSTIDVLVDGYLIPGVGTVDKGMDGDRVLITLLSKNVSAGTAVIMLSTEPNIPPPPTVEYTDTIKIAMKPWGWYTPGNVADKLIANITTIDGKIANYFSSITDYQYIRTDIATDGDYAIINIRIKSLQAMSPEIQSLVFPIAAVGAITGLIWAIVALLLIGLIAYVVIEHYTGGEPPTPGPQPDPNTVKPGVKDATDNAQANCLTGLPSNPTCSDLSTYATCLDSVDIGIIQTLEAVYPKSPEVRAFYDKYYQAYSKLAATCNTGIPGRTPTDIVNQFNGIKNQFDKDMGVVFDALQKEYGGKCTIPIAGQCADSVVLLGGLLLGGYILYKIFKGG